MQERSRKVAYPILALDTSAIDAFMPAEKIGLVATVSDQGLPHITLITSIRAASPTTITLGEFSNGLSKKYLQENPKSAFLVMTTDMRMWRGHTLWTHKRHEGPEYISYNEIPMFRYNAYFGIQTVHYLDLVDARGPEKLPLPRIAAAMLATRIARAAARTGRPDRVLPHFAYDLFARLGSLKFIAWVKPDGYPEIVPLLQCQPADTRRLVFSPIAYSSELEQIPENSPVAVFCLTMQMEDVLVRGRFTGFSRYMLAKAGVIDIDWVYNSMPPAHGQVYPPVPLNPVVFENTPGQRQ